jgi:ketosteroid isomerase-like protein
MSQNAEIVRRFIWAFEHDTDTLVELAHPEIEWFPYEENHAVFRGLDGALEVRDGWLDAWAEYHADIEEITERGDDLVVSLHLIGRGKGSGVEVDVRVYPQVKIRDGRVVYIFEHDDRAEALKAAGLSE